jgi:hypothetical protein
MGPQVLRLAEGDAMTDTAGVPRKRDGGEPGRRPLIDEELADRLLDRAQMTGHLGCEKHDPAGRGSGNSRNGTTAKTVLTCARCMTWTSRRT